MVIKVLELAELAELVVELLKRGAAFEVNKRGDGYWHVYLTGF
jgi:hypothetical protein